MSQRALLKAVRDLLRLPVGAGTPANGLGYANAVCEIMFDGQPPPSCGQLFVAVHEGDWTSNFDEAREDDMGVEITVTRRVAYLPRDRGYVALLDATDALHVEMDRIIAKIHDNENVRTAAGTIIGNLASNFHRPLFFRGPAGKTIPQGPDWFSADPDGPSPPTGVARTLRFGGATRTQRIEDQT